MAPPSSTTSAIDPTPARRKSTIPAVSATESRSSPTGIRPARHFQQINDMTGSSMTSGSPVSPERLHRSATPVDGGRMLLHILAILGFDSTAGLVIRRSNQGWNLGILPT
ncbi:hypothetical protein N7530_011313 [Penicillium desertorum]|uniref:Uncharacterized protein n=1 Tax=Penicillium desertorum TaxID=1303715 RepID=A0A9W9WH36_9EURO|nr:hypothetical protein N7530_011313 [Penicillium desertorum]